jgi:hypothetical protein
MGEKMDAPQVRGSASIKVRVGLCVGSKHHAG